MSDTLGPPTSFAHHVTFSSFRHGDLIMLSHLMPRAEQASARLGQPDSFSEFHVACGSNRFLNAKKFCKSLEVKE